MFSCGMELLGHAVKRSNFRVVGTELKSAESLQLSFFPVFVNERTVFPTVTEKLISVFLTFSNVTFLRNYFSLC